MTETDKKPEEQQNEFEDLERPRSKAWEYLDRYKRFPLWVRYGLLIAVLGMLFMQFTRVPENSYFAYMILGGLIAVLIANWGYRAGEHKSQFIRENAKWLFYLGILLIYGPLILGVISGLGASE